MLIVSGLQDVQHMGNVRSIVISNVVYREQMRTAKNQKYVEPVGAVSQMEAFVTILDHVAHMDHIGRMACAFSRYLMSIAGTCGIVWHTASAQLGMVNALRPPTLIVNTLICAPAPENVATEMACVLPPENVTVWHPSNAMIEVAFQ